MVSRIYEVKFVEGINAANHFKDDSRHLIVMYDGETLYTVRTRKLWNRKTTLTQSLSVFDVVTKQKVTYQITYFVQ